MQQTSLESPVSVTEVVFPQSVSPHPRVTLSPFTLIYKKQLKINDMQIKNQCLIQLHRYCLIINLTLILTT